MSDRQRDGESIMGREDGDDASEQSSQSIDNEGHDGRDQDERTNVPRSNDDFVVITKVMRDIESEKMLSHAPAVEPPDSIQTTTGTHKAQRLFGRKAFLSMRLKFSRRNASTLSEPTQTIAAVAAEPNGEIKEQIQSASECLQEYSRQQSEQQAVGAFLVTPVAEGEDVEQQTTPEIYLQANGSDPENSEMLLTANVVALDDSRAPRPDAEVVDVETAVRERIIREATVADFVGRQANDETEEPKKEMKSLILGLVVVAIVSIAVVILSIYFSQQAVRKSLPPGDNDHNDDGGLTGSGNVTGSSLSTLAKVFDRGHVRCGVYQYNAGFAVQNGTTGIVEGFNADLCRAVSALVFGDSAHVEFVAATSANRFQLLTRGAVDIIAQTTTHTMQRDLAERSTGEGFNFAIPFLYSGLVFGGIPDFVDCAERLDPFFGECRNLVICVGKDTTFELVLSNLLPGPAVSSQSTSLDIFTAFTSGVCNVVAADPVNLSPRRQETFGYNGPFKLGTKFFSRDPLSLVTSGRDSSWSGLVNLVMNILISGEAQNITQASATDWREEQVRLRTIDEALVKQISDVLSSVGNFGELYRRHLEEALMPRVGLNLLNLDKNNTGDSGLLYSYPYGDLAAEGRPPVTGGTLEALMMRGHLRCGVVLEPGFADFDELSGSWSGFYIEHCNALSAALFLGIPETVFVELESRPMGYSAVKDGKIDVLAAGELTLSTSQGFDFSTPIFYDNTGGASSLVSRNDDQQWSNFVYWVVMATVQAEESSISFETSIEMPVVQLFGKQFKQMFRDCISAVGNYGDIYNRTLEATVPRVGRNRLNDGLETAQHYPVPFS